MARAQKLKVFRMAVGFHDAYVAAPSQKAAAEAWGTDAQVFARKEAELVTDPALTKAPLARPGEVIKRLRGTAAEQIAALDASAGEDVPAPKRGKAAAREKAKPPAKPKPRPSRAALDKAEAALAEAEARHDAARKALAEREAALRRERKALEAKQDGELARRRARRESAREAYEQKLRRWREEG